MRRLSMLIAVMVLLSMCSFSVSAETTYSQAPMLDVRVASGEIPPVEQRLPEEPKLTDAMLKEDLDYKSGNYGGTLRFLTASVNWDPDVLCGLCESLLYMESLDSDIITPNILGGYEVSEDNTVFTFHLRKGLKWSDGEEVTIEDFAFTYNNVVFNETLTPTVSSFFRSGGSSEGGVGVFEVIDDYTYRWIFDAPYGGFLVAQSIASFEGYGMWLKPAHFLKQFHKDFAEESHGSLEAYYEFLQPFGTVMGYDDVTQEDVWMYIFNQVDMGSWETTDPNAWLTSQFFDGLVDTNFPTLYPWVMTSSDNTITTWERNPYYFKVDEDGQQLPYFDYLTSTYLESNELQQLAFISGEADFALETATCTNISMYKENEENGGYVTYLPTYHYTPTDIRLNINWGLNSDGTLSDNEESKGWQEVVNDARFRRAMMLSIDAEEMLDTVYNGFGEVYSLYECTGDTEQANTLLDEMGCVDIDGDGFREAPSGSKINFTIWNRNPASDVIPACEMYVEFFSSIGINTTISTVDGSYLWTTVSTNKVPSVVEWTMAHSMWHYRDWDHEICAPLFRQLSTDGSVAETLANVDTTEGVRASAAQYDVFTGLIDQLFTVSPSEAVTSIMPQLSEMMAQDLMWNIMPLTNVANPVLLNADIGNVPVGGMGIAWNFAIEQMFYNNPDQH